VHVGGKQSQIRGTAPVERQLNDLLCVDQLAVFARIGLERRRRARHVHGFGNHAKLEGNVHALAGIHVHLHVRGRGLAEARVLHCNRVAADSDVKEVIVSGLVRDRLRLDAGFLVAQRHRGFRDNRIRIVANRAENLGGIELRQ
jgi:hypothetical protein